MQYESEKIWHDNQPHYAPMYAEALTQIVINDRTLTVIYDKQEDGLHFMKSDDIVKNIINNYIDEVFQYAIKKVDTFHYVLNIASTENFGDFDWNGDPWSNDLLRKQINIYKPLIQKFIIEAMTGTI